jgi:hypothetical protein
LKPRNAAKPFGVCGVGAQQELDPQGRILFMQGVSDQVRSIV